MSFKKVVWSPVEIEFLRTHQSLPVSQLCIQLAKSQNAIKKKMVEISGTTSQSPTMTNNVYKNRIGRRKDCDNLFLRSSWEANVYRLLKTDINIALIEYEPTTFSFAPFGILKGTVSYTPDFKITYHNGNTNWIEVKGGLLKQADKVKIRRFKKYFPGEFALLKAITPGEKSKTAKFFQETGVEIKWYYPELTKEYKNKIPNWEK